MSNFTLNMKKTVLHLSLLAGIILYSKVARSQTLSTDSAAEKNFKPHGTLWGNAFGDYAYKLDADTVDGGRGSDQYSGVPKSRQLFQFRRIYLGYSYDVSPSFSAELLMAAEDDITSGDLLVNNKFAPYIKLANIRWKNIWKGTDIVFGQVSTPAFPLLSERIWGIARSKKLLVILGAPLRMTSG